MAMVEIKSAPSTRDLRIFALLWLIFLPLIGLALTRMDSLLVPVVVTSVCLLASLALNRDEPKRRQLVGLALPVVLLAIWALMALPDGDPGRRTMGLAIAGMFGLAGAAGAAVTLTNRHLGERLYTAWMLTVLPLGWMLSHLLLAVVYYAVITPIGVGLRLIGRDLLALRADPKAKTYWHERTPSGDDRRYMRQH
jgi:Saxitoxin biosynthesis operon protein SxtJ